MAIMCGVTSLLLEGLSVRPFLHDELYNWQIYTGLPQNISHFKIKFCHSTVRSFNTQLYHYSTPAHRHTQTPPTLAHSQTHTAQHTHTHTHSDTHTRSAEHTSELH